LDDYTDVKNGIFISDFNAHIGKGRIGYKSVSVHFKRSDSNEDRRVLLDKCNINTCTEED
jgi:hypothetical protein